MMIETATAFGRSLRQELIHAKKLWALECQQLDCDRALLREASMSPSQRAILAAKIRVETERLQDNARGLNLAIDKLNSNSEG